MAPKRGGAGTVGTESPATAKRNASSTRALRPRPVVVVRPSFVSDETCFAVLGVTPRKFRDVVVPRCGEVTRLGHTVLVAIDEVERVVRALATNYEDNGNTDEKDDDSATTVEGVLARLGKVRTA